MASKVCGMKQPCPNLRHNSDIFIGGTEEYHRKGQTRTAGVKTRLSAPQIQDMRSVLAHKLLE